MMAQSCVAIYLIVYNVAQACGWSVVLFKITLNAVENHSLDGAFDCAGDLVSVLQLAALLEAVHAMTGLVPSGILPSLLQWGGRYHWIAAIVYRIKEVQRLPSVFITLAAWSLSEVIRYPQYALSTLKICPQWLTWLRYTSFIPLYPLGALPGEVLLLYKALPYIKKKNLYGCIFEKLPFTYYSVVVVILSLYPFLWFSLYLYMFKQRQYKLGKQFSGRRKTRSKSD